MSKTNYRGDTGGVRKSLAKAGFSNDYIFSGLRTMFNDVSKSRATRRIKLWFANDVFEAPCKQQRKLDRALKAEFGSRYLGGYFVAVPSWARGDISFCVKLTGY